MPWHQLETYVLDVRDNGNPCLLTTQLTTASAFGWDARYPTWVDWYLAEIAAGRRKGRFGSARIPHGTQTHRLSRSPKRAGWPKGSVHSFRISDNTKIRLLAEALNSIQVDWHWVARPNGARWAKEDLQRIFPPTP